MATLGVRSRVAAGSVGGAHFLLDQAPQTPQGGPKPGAQSDSPDLGNLLRWSLAALGAVVIGLLLLNWQTEDPDFVTRAVPAPMEGLTIFAMFFVAAQAIERLLEPLSMVLLPKTDKSDEAAKKADEAASKVDQWEAASEPEREPARTAAEAALQSAATAKAKVDERLHERVVVFWALATLVAMSASALLNLYFLRRVGISTGSRWVEILATGLIIGAGTKPLHDVISMISAKKEQAQVQGNKEDV